MRLDIDIGLYPEHFNAAIKWYNMAFLNKKPSPKDKETVELFFLLVKDMARQEKEDKEAEKE